MERLPLLLALNGMAVLIVALFAGLFLYRGLLRGDPPHDWHLLHAGGSGRGLMLLALAATVHLTLLPAWLLAAAVWGMIVFCWASTIAMTITAVTGEHGFRQQGPALNRLAHGLYVVGAAAVFPSAFALLSGLVLRLAAPDAATAP